MKGVSIRLRLTLWYSGVLLLALIGFGAGMSVLLHQRLIAGLDAALGQRIAGLATTLELEGNLPREQLRIEVSEFAKEIPEGELMELRDDSGFVLLPDPPRAPRFPARQAGHQTIEAQDGQYRILASHIAVKGKQFDAVVAASLAGVDGVMADFRRSLLLLIPAVLVFAALGGYWISSRALAPVDEITRVARSISVENLSRRLAVPRSGDEIQRMSETWNEVLERLEGAVKRIRQFTADASHELRTPVALIRATAELALRRERGATEYRDSLRQIQTEAERMTDLTESLLTLARADANGTGMPRERTDLGGIVRSVVEQAEAAAAAKGIAIAGRVEASPVMAAVNEPAIRRLLLILVDNALKHTPAGGSVTVGAAPNGAGATVSVADTGEGIAAEALPHVFERFYRADTARPSGSGTGLGLSIAQQIAQAHQSAITVESAPGEGARFSVVLPA